VRGEPSAPSAWSGWENEQADEELRRRARRARTEDEHLEVMREAGGLDSGARMLAYGRVRLGLEDAILISALEQRRAAERACVPQLEPEEAHERDLRLRQRQLGMQIIEGGALWREPLTPEWGSYVGGPERERPAFETAVAAELAAATEREESVMTEKLQAYSEVVARIAAEGAALEQRAEALTVASAEADATARGMVADIRVKLREAEAARKQAKAPYLKASREIDAAFSTAAGPWKRADAALSVKLSQWHAAQIAAREATQREQERAERERIAAAAAGRPQAEAAPAAPLPQAPPTTVKTEAGRVTMVERRGFQIVDPDQIPREYMLPDRVRIGEVYRSGGDVPGCKEDVTYVPRTTKGAS